MKRHNQRFPQLPRSGKYLLPESHPITRRYRLTMAIRSAYSIHEWKYYVSDSSRIDDPIEKGRAITMSVLIECQRLIEFGRYSSTEVYGIIKQEVRSNAFTPNTVILNIVSRKRFEASVKSAVKLCADLRLKAFMATSSETSCLNPTSEHSNSTSRPFRRGYFAIARMIYAAFYHVKKWLPHAGQLKLDMPLSGEYLARHTKLTLIGQAKIDAVTYSVVRQLKTRPDTLSTTLRVLEAFLIRKGFAIEIPNVWVAIYNFYYGDAMPALDELDLSENQGQGQFDRAKNGSQLKIQW